MSYPSSSSAAANAKPYTEEEIKLIKFMRQLRSQPVEYNEHATNSSHVEPNKYRDTPEVIHIPPKFQQIKYGLNLPEAYTSVIRRTAMIQKERESNNHPQTATRRPSASMDDEHIRKSNN